MASPFHVDGEFSPYRALLVAVLVSVVLVQVGALVMLTRGQVLQAAQREAQAHTLPVATATAPDATLAPPPALSLASARGVMAR